MIGFGIGRFVTIAHVEPAYCRCSQEAITVCISLYHFTVRNSVHWKRDFQLLRDTWREYGANIAAVNKIYFSKFRYSFQFRNDDAFYANTGRSEYFFGSNKCRKCDVFPSCLLGGTSSKRQSRFPIGNIWPSCGKV